MAACNKALFSWENGVTFEFDWCCSVPEVLANAILYQ